MRSPLLAELHAFGTCYSRGTVAVVQDAPVACCARDAVLAERALATPAVRGARFWRRPLFAERFASGPRCSRRTLPAEDAARRTPLAEHAAREARCLRSTLYAVHAALGTLRLGALRTQRIKLSVHYESGALRPGEICSRNTMIAECAAPGACCSCRLYARSTAFGARCSQR